MSILAYVPPAALTSLPVGIWSGVDNLPVFPWLPGQAITLSKGMTWSTGVKKSASGRIRTKSYWSDAIWEFEVQYEVVRQRPTITEWNILNEFFGTMKGQRGFFLFVDPLDCQIAGAPPIGSPILDLTGAPILDLAGQQILDMSGGAGGGQVFGIGDGATRAFQLIRPINSYTEPVYGAFQVVVYDNGTLVSTSTYSVANGVVTFLTPPAPGHLLIWFGYFYFGCHFAQDDLTLDKIVDQLWSGKALKFESLMV